MDSSYPQNKVQVLCNTAIRQCIIYPISHSILSTFLINQHALATLCFIQSSNEAYYFHKYSGLCWAFSPHSFPSLDFLPFFRSHSIFQEVLPKISCQSYASSKVFTKRPSIASFRAQNLKFCVSIAHLMSFSPSNLGTPGGLRLKSNFLMVIAQAHYAWHMGEVPRCSINICWVNR